VLEPILVRPRSANGNDYFEVVAGARRLRAAFAAKLEAGATVIDVRTASEFSSGAYPGAKNVPLDKLAAKLKPLGDKDKPLVVYCASGSRSVPATKILKAAGFTDVTNAGGLHSMPR